MFDFKLCNELCSLVSLCVRTVLIELIFYAVPCTNRE